MRYLTSLSMAAIYGFAVCLIAGCPAAPAPAPAPVESSDDHDHGDHDHEHDDHDHGDHEHDHGDHAHDHGDHDHGDHDHEHGDHEHGDDDAHAAPKNLHEAVDMVAHLSEEIGEAFSKGDIDAGHGPLHEIGEILEAAGLMIGKGDLSDDQKNDAAEAVAALNDLYGQVDAKLHDEEGVDYKDVASEISAALEALEKATGVEHDHDK